MQTGAIVVVAGVVLVGVVVVSVVLAVVVIVGMVAVGVVVDEVVLVGVVVVDVVDVVVVGGAEVGAGHWQTVPVTWAWIQAWAVETREYTPRQVQHVFNHVTVGHVSTHLGNYSTCSIM